MKKKILTGIFSLFILNSLIGQSLIASYAEISGFTSFSLSVYLSDSLSKKAATLEVDNDSFDRFLKYSMYVTDKDALTIEQIDLCKTVFATERSSSPNLRCIYARETIKSGEKPKRGSIDDKQFLADMSGYNTIDIFPDIVYYDIYDAYNMGQTSEVVEYWLDDNGNERVIAQAGMEGPYYQIYYDKAPDYAELDKVIEFCDKGGTLIDNDDGSFIYAGMINGRKYKENKTFEIYTADIWKYIIKDDGTAVITDCTLPKGIDVEPINEPIVLPNELDGHKVTSITCSFSDSCITKLVIPENYRHIERFVNMKYLKEVEINSPELNLVSPCFLSCPDLECVKLNVKSVGTGTFVECPQLHKVEINGAEEIACCAFSDLPALNEVTLPDNLKYIGQDAFTNTNVTELVIPKNVEIIGILRPCYIKNGELVDPLTLDCIKIANDECIIKGYSNTEAQIYADTNGYNFVSFDANYGDANCDGSVDMADVVLIMQALANPNKYGIDGTAEHHLTEQGRINGDMDGNGLTVGDAQAIQMKLLGLEVSDSRGNDNQYLISIQYETFSRDYPYYNTISDLANKANQVFSGTVKNISFEILDIRTMQPIKDGEDIQWATLCTIYEIEAEEVYAGTPISVKLRIEGGIPSGFEQEQIALLGNGKIPVMEDAPVLTIGEKYLFALYHAENTEYSSILNPLQSVYTENEVKEGGFSAAEIIAYFQ